MREIHAQIPEVFNAILDGYFIGPYFFHNILTGETYFELLRSMVDRE